MVLRPSRFIFFAFFIVCTSQIIFGSDSAAVLGSTLLQQAHTISHAAFAHPLKQTGQLTVLTGPKPIDATYTYVGTGQAWHEKIEAPGYSEVRVRTGSEEKVQRPADREPLALLALFQALRALDQLRLSSTIEEHVTRLRNEKVAHVPAKCLQIEGKSSSRSVCVYDDGTLAALRSGPGMSYEYSDYVTFDGLQFPTKIRGAEHGSAMFEIKLSPPQAITADTVPNDTFQPTLVLGWCEDGIGPVLQKQVPPIYPDIAKRLHKTGSVDLYAVINTDGHLRNLGPVRSAGPDLDKAAIEAVSRWNYYPAMCGTTPVSTEVLITVNFTM